MTDILSAVQDSSIAQTASYVVVAVLGAVFGVQKLLKNWKETSTETNIISLMHEELTRLSKHNQTLADELAKFQLEIVALNKQLNNLTVENTRLHNEISTLNLEVNRLQTMITTQTKKD